MATQEELITAFRKETEDLVYANIEMLFLIKHGEKVLSPGENTVTFTGDPYDDNDDYVIGFYEALDADGIDVKGELNITEQTINGFKVEAVRPTNIKWITYRKSPKINYWT
jgi:hypothetical protein